MVNKTENPRAFPVANEGFVQNGMTLRDYFAGQALAGLCANSTINIDIDGWRLLVEGAFNAADEMLEQR